MTDMKQLSLIEAAEQILKQNRGPMTFLDLFKHLSDAKGMTEADISRLISQFYADFIISAKFVYTGDDLWDLKSRQSIDLWDKDGAYYQEFPEDEEEVEEEEEEVIEDEEEAELDEDVEEEDLELGEVVEKDFEDEFVDDDEEALADQEEFDDDKYNEYMDDYEDMYDE